MTFYAVLSLAPTLLIAIAIAGYFYEDAEVQQEIIDQFAQLADEQTVAIVKSLLRNATRPAAGIVAGTISLLISLIGASGIFSQLYDTFNDIWDVPNEDRSGWWFMIQKRLIGIAMVVLVGVLLLATLVLSSILAYLNTLVQDTVPQFPQLQMWLKFVDQGLLYLLMPLVFSATFWFFPATNVKLRDVIPAGLLTALLVAASHYLVEAYLRFSSTSEVYGAAGSLVVLLIWLYIVGMCLFFGASFCYAYSQIRINSATETVPENVEAEEVTPAPITVVRRR